MATNVRPRITRGDLKDVIRKMKAKGFFITCMVDKPLEFMSWGKYKTCLLNEEDAPSEYPVGCRGLIRMLPLAIILSEHDTFDLGITCVNGCLHCYRDFYIDKYEFLYVGKTENTVFSGLNGCKICNFRNRNLWSALIKFIGMSLFILL